MRFSTAILIVVGAVTSLAVVQSVPMLITSRNTVLAASGAGIMLLLVAVALWGAGKLLSKLFKEN